LTHIIKDVKFKDGSPVERFMSYSIVDGTEKWFRGKSEFEGEGKDKKRISNIPDALISADISVPN